MAGRVAGIDLGAKRIGVAVSDLTGSLASPHTVVVRSGDAEADRRRLVEVVREAEAERVVVGLPLRLSGRPGPEAEAARAERDALAAALDPIPVDLVDERLTTVSAGRGMSARGVKAKKQRASIDAEAAAVLLQSWLDGARAR